MYHKEFVMVVNTSNIFWRGKKRKKEGSLKASFHFLAILWTYFHLDNMANKLSDSLCFPAKTGMYLLLENFCILLNVPASELIQNGFSINSRQMWPFVLPLFLNGLLCQA